MGWLEYCVWLSQDNIMQRKNITELTITELTDSGAQILSFGLSLIKGAL